MTAHYKYLLILLCLVLISHAADAADSRPLTSSTWLFYTGPTLLPANWYLDPEQYLKTGEGAMPLGYGDSKLETEIWSSDSGSEPYPAAYFAQSFKWRSNTQDDKDRWFRIYLGCDDGCVLYLNGVELARNRMPDGEIAPFSAFTMGDEEAFAVIRLPTSLLHDGMNEIAVEVHQVSPSSSDLRFNTRLVVE